MNVRFSKYEGLSNDFIVVDATEPSVSSSAAVALCDRHTGIGADGVLVTGLRNGRPFMHVTNADGSHAEMCGNGIRCVALHLVRTGQASARTLTIDTDAGPHVCRVGAGSEEADVEVEMRQPSLEPKEIGLVSHAPLLDERLQFDGHAVRLTGVSMGNAHVVTFDDLSVQRLELGPRIGGDTRFANGVNVGFARVSSPDHIELDVWERGSGWTRACGTGACAAAVAAVETGRASRNNAIAVRLPGGILTIRVGNAGTPVVMKGPARHVFDGVVDVARALPTDVRPKAVQK